jgi:uncharacterized membrane protein YccC
MSGMNRRGLFKFFAVAPVAAVISTSVTPIWRPLNSPTKWNDMARALMRSKANAMNDYYLQRLNGKRVHVSEVDRQFNRT